jgi:hypothetical protein
MVGMIAETISPMILMGGMAVVFAIGLGIAGKVFYVYEDPKIAESPWHLPTFANTSEEATAENQQ